MRKTRFRKGDVLIADNIIRQLLESYMVSQSKMDSIEHKRTIYTLQELGYLRDDKTHLMQTQLTKFYFDDGGGKRIYRESLTSIIEDKIKLLKSLYLKVLNNGYNRKGDYANT